MQVQAAQGQRYGPDTPHMAPTAASGVDIALVRCWLLDQPGAVCFCATEQNVVDGLHAGAIVTLAATSFSSQPHAGSPMGSWYHGTSV